MREDKSEPEVIIDSFWINTISPIEKATNIKFCMFVYLEQLFVPLNQFYFYHQSLYLDFSGIRRYISWGLSDRNSKKLGNEYK